MLFHLDKKARQQDEYMYVFMYEMSWGKMCYRLDVKPSRVKGSFWFHIYGSNIKRGSFVRQG